MSNDNNQQIKITISTPTSNRPMQNARRRYIQPRIYYSITTIPYNIPQTNMYNFLDELERVRNMTMNDGELKRDDDVQLDIERRNCRIAEVNHTCVVCQDKFVMGEKLSTLETCNHTFHYSCLDEWGRYKQECPICRSVIPILDD